MEILPSKVVEDLLVLQELDRLEFMAMTNESDIEWTPPLTKLVGRLITHYENHYRVESNLIKENVRVLLLLSPEWPSYLEDAFLWVGGWRPSMAFHLLDFNPGVGLGELLEGVCMGEFRDILPSQLVRVGELQRHTIQAEAELTHSLSDSVSPDEKDTESDSVMAELFVAPNDQQGLGEVFGKADDLRLRTLKKLVQILSPIQAVQLFIPAAQLHLNVQKWGKSKEAAHTTRTHLHNDNIGSDRGRCRGGGRVDFGGFFEIWLREQETDLEELSSAAKAYTESNQSQYESTRNLRVLVARVLCHYENYYRVKSESVKQNVFLMLTPAWRSLLEHAFLWIGGWRPTMVFHLLYTVLGLQLEARLGEPLLEGLTRMTTTTGDLVDLSSSQLTRVDELQMKTVKEERVLTEMLASMQETVADSSMVQLSRKSATELKRDRPELRIRERVSLVRTESVNQRVESTLGPKEDKLKEIFGKADDLRIKTLINVVDVLNPIQAVHFLIAAAELHLRFHDWGKNKDAAAHQQQH